MTQDATPKGLRDRPLGRLLMLGAVLAAALLAARSCADSTPDFSKERAIELARSVAVFEPEHVQIRFVRRGMPSRCAWAISLYQGAADRPRRFQVVVVDAEDGTLIDDGT